MLWLIVILLIIIILLMINKDGFLELLKGLFKFFFYIVVPLFIFGYMYHQLSSPTEKSSSKTLSEPTPVIPQPNTLEPEGDNRAHYDWLMAECEVNMKLIEEHNFTKNAKQLGRRNYCSEGEEMRERITGIADSNAKDAKDF